MTNTVSFYETWLRTGRKKGSSFFPNSPEAIQMYTKLVTKCISYAVEMISFQGFQWHDYFNFHFHYTRNICQAVQHFICQIKKNFTPLTRFARSAASGEAQPYLPLRSLRSLRICASRSRFSVTSLPWASRFALATYPMSLPGSQAAKECPCQVSCQLDQNCGR